MIHKAEKEKYRKDGSLNPSAVRNKIRFTTKYLQELEDDMDRIDSSALEVVYALVKNIHTRQIRRREEQASSGSVPDELTP